MMLIAPVKDGLRALQHFDPVEVEHVEIHLGKGCEIDIVHIYGYGRIVGRGEIVEADAADGDDLLSAGNVVLHVQIRHLGHQVCRRHDTVLAQIFRADGRDVDADIHDVLGALFGRDGHGLDRVAGLRLRLCLARERRQARGKEQRGSSSRGHGSHLSADRHGMASPGFR